MRDLNIAFLNLQRGIAAAACAAEELDAAALDARGTLANQTSIATLRKHAAALEFWAEDICESIDEVTHHAKSTSTRANARTHLKQYIRAVAVPARSTRKKVDA
jgi:hypothetical protein